MIQKWGGLTVKSPLSEDFCQLIIKLSTISLGPKPILQRKSHFLPTDSSTIKVYEFN